jgi:uncharacterized damage-inducible protein DinB
MSYSQNRRGFVKRVALGTSGVIAARGAYAMTHMPSGSSSVERFLETFGRATDLNMAFAEKMPAEHYGFRPVPEIRSYAEQLLHVAGANVFFTGTYLVDGAGLDADFEPENPTKEMVIELMKESDEHVRASIQGMTDESMSVVVETFAGKLMKSEVCWLMRDHMTHHRGQMIIYLRLNGLEPPQYVGV